MSLRSTIRRLPGYDELIELMPSSRAAMSFAEDTAADVMGGSASRVRLLDLGCGSGDSVEFFSGLTADVDWHGVDIEDSPEVGRRQRTDDRILSFDGVNLPYDDGYFDVVYSRQVLEHVRRPRELMNDVSRIIRPGGRLVGSVAYLEPYHSLSTFNFTPFGLACVMQDSGLQPESFRHSSDVVFAVVRQLLNKAGFMRHLRRISLLYLAIEIGGRLAGLDRRQINLMKIQYSSSFCFVARKPD